MSEFYEEMKTLRYSTLTPEMKEATKAALRHFFKERDVVVLRYQNHVIARTAWEWLLEEGFSAGNNGTFGVSGSIFVSVDAGLFAAAGPVDAVILEDGTWEVVPPKVEEPPAPDTDQEVGRPAITADHMATRYATLPAHVLAYSINPRDFAPPKPNRYSWSSLLDYLLRR